MAEKKSYGDEKAAGEKTLSSWMDRHKKLKRHLDYANFHAILLVRVPPSSTTSSQA